MTYRASQQQLLAAILGTINGLSVGGIAYAILWLDVAYQNQRISESSECCIHVSVGIKWYGLPLIGGIIFTVGSLLVYRYIANRVGSIVLLWQYVGAASVVCGIFLLISIDLIQGVSGGFSFDYKKFIAPQALLRVLVAFLFVATINLFYGTFIRLGVTLYMLHKKTEFP